MYGYNQLPAYFFGIHLRPNKKDKDFFLPFLTQIFSVFHTKGYFKSLFLFST